ncbi:MAG: hypothetical protein HUJ94_00425 [Bacteroidales bacterium]|nr:hypothetical protein [Bacteroidales bacterium]
MRVSNSLLFSEVETLIEEGKSVVLNPAGRSMSPFIVEGRDTVTLHSPAAPLKVGQIVLARLQNAGDAKAVHTDDSANPGRAPEILAGTTYVLHRIIKISPAGKGEAVDKVCADKAGSDEVADCVVTLMGDGNLQATEICTRANILGVVTAIGRNGRTVNPESISERLKASLWKILLPFRRYLLYLWRRFPFLFP